MDETATDIVLLVAGSALWAVTILLTPSRGQQTYGLLRFVSPEAQSSVKRLVGVVNSVLWISCAILGTACWVIALVE